MPGLVEGRRSKGFAMCTKVSRVNLADLMRNGYCYRPGVGLFTTNSGQDERLETLGGLYFVQIDGKEVSVDRDDIIFDQVFGRVHKCSRN